MVLSILPPKPLTYITTIKKFQKKKKKSYLLITFVMSVTMTVLNKNRRHVLFSYS